MKKHNMELIETMTLLIEMQAQSCRWGIFSIEPMVEEVSEPFLKKGLIMCINGYNSESIRMTLTLEVDSTDIY
jgi:chemotaxis protein MotA